MAITVTEILKTEYSKDFDLIRQTRMATSFFKYGALRDNYKSIDGKKPLVDALENLEDRVEKFKQTHNPDFLLDIANMAMILFMYPQKPEVKIDAEGHGTRLIGMTINDIKKL